MLPNEQQAIIHRDRAYRLYNECRMAEAVQELASAIQQDGRDAKSWQLLSQIYGGAGFHEAAASYCQKALREDYTNMGAWTILANLYSQVGGLYLDLALEQIDLAKEVSEDNPHILYIEGNIWAQKGNYERARELFQKALERFPNHPYAQKDLAALGG